MDSQDPVLTLEERRDARVDALYVHHGYTEDGVVDVELIVDALFPTVSKAVAAKTIDRPRVCVHRRALVECAFPGLIGPEGWSETDDPDLSEAVYKKCDSAVWRLTSIAPHGKLQQRLNSDAGLVLCRTKVNPHATPAVYVTADRKCILEDIIKPTQKREKALAARDAELT